MPPPYGQLPGINHHPKGLKWETDAQASSWPQQEHIRSYK